ncbi:MAG: hypothetical protein HYV60_07585 [Planctomycetia bacterium]|nr:hypothetical protein [Planctomycetia bacterium]
MTNDDAAAHVDHYVKATQAAHDAGFWPVFSNPGAPTPEPYFKRPAADVIVIHENETFPAEEMLRGDYFGGYADYPSFTRAVLVHSFKTFDREKFTMSRKYVRWIYVTHDRFDSKADPNDPQNNPWAGAPHLREKEMPAEDEFLVDYVRVYEGTLPARSEK